MIILRINKLEEEIGEFRIRFSDAQQKIQKSFYEVTKLIEYLRQDHIDQIKDSKHDIYHKVSELFEERISANEEYLVPFLTHLEAQIEKLNLRIEQSESQLSILFQNERIELEKVRGCRTNNTFKNLKAAFSANGKTDKDDD